MSNEQRMYQQLGFLQQRLQSYPHSNHECRAINDILQLLIRTIAGEEIDMGSEIIGGGQLQPGVNIQVDQQYKNRGGVQIAEGVIQYPPPNAQQSQGIPNQPGGIQVQTIVGPAPIDVEAGLAAFTGKAPAGRPDLVPQPLPGSLMDVAQRGGTIAVPPNGEEAENKALSEMESILDKTSPAPGPGETRVEVTPPKE